MKNFLKKVFIVCCSVLLLAGFVNPAFSITTKADESIKYIIVNYKFEDGTDIPDVHSQTKLAIYNEKEKRYEYKFDNPDTELSGYTWQFKDGGNVIENAKSPNGSFHSLPVIIVPKDDNTIDNPVKVTLVYENKSNTEIPVNCYCKYIYEDKTERNQSLKPFKASVNSIYTNTYTLDKSSDNGYYDDSKTPGVYYVTNDGQEQLVSDFANYAKPDGSFSIDVDGSGINISNVDHINIYWYYKGEKAKSNTFTVTDNFIMSDGKVVYGLNGADYFGRKDGLSPTNGSIIVTSPTRGSYNGTTLTLSKVIYETGDGDPFQAVNKKKKEVDGRGLSSPYSVTFSDLSDTGYTQYIHYYWIYDAGTKPDPDKPIPPVDENKPPVVNISAPEQVVMGDDCNIRGKGYDPEGDTVSLDWSYSENLHDGLEGKGNVVWFSQEGDEEIDLEGTDSKGLKGYADTTIEVLPPKPQVRITAIGNKVNRKATIDMLNSSASQTNGKSNRRYPIDYSKTVWQITPADGLTLNDLKTLAPHTVSGSSMIITGDVRAISLLSKKKGTLIVQCSIWNKAGYSGFSRVNVYIEPDLPPVADFNIPPTSIRDPKNNNLADIQLTDMSSSPDNDTIAKRIWLYAYDSNNDGNYDNEEWYVYNNDSWQKVSDITGGSGDYADAKNINIDKVNDGNLTTVHIFSKYVGKRDVELIVREGYTGDLNDPLVKKYVNLSDFLRADTFTH